MEVRTRQEAEAFLRRQLFVFVFFSLLQLWELFHLMRKSHIVAIDNKFRIMGRKFYLSIQR